MINKLYRAMKEKSTAKKGKSEQNGPYTLSASRVCALCGRSEEYVTLEAHHTYRRINGDETIWLCSTPHPYHGRSCHKLAGENIELAKELGIYKEMKTNFIEKDNEANRKRE